MKRFVSFALLTPLALASACSNQPAEPGSGDDKPTIVTAFYALEYTAQQIVGDQAKITTLTLPGAEPHDLELKPSQIAEIGQADLVVYLKDFQPAVDEAITQSGNKHLLDAATLVDLLPFEADQEHSHESETGHDHEGEESEHAAEHGDEGHVGDDEDSHDHGDFDPHYWLDPNRMAKVGQALADELSQQYPDSKDTFQENATKFTAAMSELDGEYKTGLKQCQRHEFITSHTAFNYLAKNYGLTEIGISGINPDDEPSPARIAEVQSLAKEHGVTTIFFETLTSPDVSKAIAGDLGLTTAVLDPLEGITNASAGSDYPSVMRANLKALKEANGCK